MATFITGKKNGETVEFKIADDGKVYKGNGLTYLGFYVSSQGNIVSSSGKILQNSPDVKKYLQKIGQIDWFYIPYKGKFYLPFFYLKNFFFPL